MGTRWFDHNTDDVVPGDVIEAFCKEFMIREDCLARFFELVRVEAGPGGPSALAYVCGLCGGPVGNVDPDKAKWIKLTKTCLSCYEG